MKKGQRRDLAVNRKARHDYAIMETLEAGIVLSGPEVRSCRDGKISFKDCFVKFVNEEAWLYHCHISPYRHARAEQDPERPRKLLLKKREIKRWQGKVSQKGLTVIPLRFYLKNGKIKVEIALAQGLKKYEKKEILKQRILEREAKESWR